MVSSEKDVIELRINYLVKKLDAKVIVKNIPIVGILKRLVKNVVFHKH